MNTNTINYNQLSQIPATLTPQPISTTKTTYSQKLLTEKNMKKDQAIIINSLPDVPFKQYLIALGSIINPNTIISASRISQQRICVFLNTRENAENLIKNHKSIKVENQITSIRSYITPTHRLLIWAMPLIPHQIIVNKLKQYGAEPTSEMYNVSAGINETGYNHITSFRRFIFVRENHPNLPESIEIPYEDEIYRVSITTDDTKCNKCKKYGHETENCRSIINNYQINTTNTNQNKNIEKNMEKDVIDPSNTMEEDEQDITKKRQRSATNSSQDSEPETIKKPCQLTQNTTNIIEKEAITQQEQLTPIETIHTQFEQTSSTQSIPIPITIDESSSEDEIETTINQDTQETDPKTPTSIAKKDGNKSYIEELKIPMELEPEQYILNYEQLKKLLHDSHGVKNISHAIKKYDPDNLIHTINLLYDILKNPHTKTVFTKLKTKIINSKSKEKSNNQTTTNE